MLLLLLLRFFMPLDEFSGGSLAGYGLLCTFLIYARVCAFLPNPNTITLCMHHLLSQRHGIGGMHKGEMHLHCLMSTSKAVFRAISSLRRITPEQVGLCYALFFFWRQLVYCSLWRS